MAVRDASRVETYYNSQKMHAQTRRQREVLDFISRYIDSHGYRPSYQVIARHMGVSSRAGIARIVRDLEQQGFLERRRVDGHFAISITGANHQLSDGPAIEWLQLPANDESENGFSDAPFVVPDFMMGGHSPNEIRALRVADDAMSANAICRGDIALIELRSFARDGDIVAAVIERNRMLLRRYFRASSEIDLVEADPASRVIRLSADAVIVLGVFRGLMRPIF
jgi:repressor LexA